MLHCKNEVEANLRWKCCTACFGEGSVSKEGIRFCLLYKRAASAWSVEVSLPCMYAGRVTKMLLWHLFSLLVNLLFLCPQIPQIQLCIERHTEFSTLCWKLKFAVSAWIFSQSASWRASVLYPYIWYPRSRGEIKGEWFYLCEFQKNLGVSGLGIGPCSVSVEEIQLHCSYRCAVGSWSLVSCFWAQRSAFHVQLYPWKPVERGCILPSLNTAEGKISPSDFENKFRKLSSCFTSAMWVFALFLKRLKGTRFHSWTANFPWSFWF